MGAQGTELMAWMAARATMTGRVTKVHSNYHVPISNTATGLLALQCDDVASMVFLNDDANTIGEDLTDRRREDGRCGRVMR